MIPWTFESKGFTNKQWKNLVYISNDEIDSYMDPETSNSKMFLIGTKGCGKTMLLHKMAYEYLHGERPFGEEDVKLKNLSDNLVEVLAFTGVEMSESVLLELKDQNRWKDVWTFAIGYQILKISGTETPKKLSAVLEDFDYLKGIRYIVPHILNHYDTLLYDEGLFRNNILIMSLVSGLQDRYILFLDGLDQALNELISSSRYADMQEKDPSLMYRIWQAAQFGLLHACHDITTSHNRRIQIYATAREEALRINDQMSINLKSFCVNLEYTDKQLLDIFRLNIEATNEKHCYGSRHDSPLKRMFGCESMAHLVPKCENGELCEEDGLQLVIRHTFRRPRELVLLGASLYSDFNVNLNGEKFASEQRKFDMRMLINEQSNKEILNSYKREIFPPFKEDYLDDFLRGVKTNVFSRAVLDRLEPEVVNYLFRTGLLGYVKGNTQYFGRTITNINPERNKIPFSDYYLVHPSLDLRFQELYSNDDFYDKRNIVGHGLEFRRPKRSIYAIISDLEVDSFIPKDIAGRSDNKWAQAKIFSSPKELYQQLFLVRQEEKLSQLRLKHIQDADRLLTQLLLRLGAKIIEDILQIDKTYFINDLDEKIMELRTTAHYGSPIHGIDERDLTQFAHRVFGRLSILGMLLALNYDNSRAKTVIQTFNPAHNKSTNSTIASDSTFLRHAFFIANLPEHSPISLDQSRAIWQDLSAFERLFLRNWFLKAAKHNLFGNGNFSEREKHYLEGKIKKLNLAILIEEDGWILRFK